MSLRNWLRMFTNPARRPLRNRLSKATSVELLEDRTTPATFTWIGGGPDSNWSTAANWSGAAPTGLSVTDGLADTFVFDTGTVGFVNVAASFAPVNDLAGTDYVSLAITDGSASGDFLLSGGLLRANVLSTINTSVTVGAGATVQNSLQLDAFASSVTTSTGQLSFTGTINGVGGFDKLGAGTLVVSNTNGYGGGTQISAGTLTVTNSGALGTGAVTMNGGTLNTSVNLANNFTLNATTNTFAPNNNYRLLSGQLSGAGGFVVANGGGTPGLQLSNPANNFGGNVTINGGTFLRLSSSEVLPNTASVTNNGNLRLDVVGGGTETVAGLTGSGSVWVPIGNNAMHTLVVGANNATSAYSGTVGAGGQNNAFLSLTKIGIGTQTLSGANVYTGPTTINAGVVLLSGGGTTSTASTISINNTGTLRFGRNDTWGVHTSDVSSPIVINAGGTLETGGFYNTLVNPTLNGGVIALTGGANATFPALALKGTVTVGGSQASQINVVSGVNNAINIGDDTLGATVFNVADVAAGVDLIVNAPLQNNQLTNANSITKTGLGTMSLNGASTYTGATAVNAGVVVAGSSGAVGTSSVSVASGATFDVNAQDLSARAFTIAGTGAAGQIASLVNTNAGPAEASVGNVTLSGPATIGTTGSKLNLFGTSVNGGGFTLTVAGTGETNVRTDNSLQAFAGITVNTTGGGRLRLESSQAPSTPFTISVNSGARVDTYGTRTYGSNLSLSLAGGAILEAAGPGGNTATWNGAIVVTGANASVVANRRIDFFGLVSGAGSIAKTGGDVLNFRGGVSLLTGLSISAGRVRFEGTGFGAWGGPITVNATGTLSPYNTGSTAANLILNGGTLSIENAGTATYNGTVSVTAPSTIDAGPGLAVVLGNAISGSSNLTKTGAGTATFSALSPAYTGQTNVNAGTLFVNGSVAGPVVVTAPGTLGGNGTINGAVSGNGTVAAGLSPGTLTINGPFTPTGTVSFEVNPPSNLPGVNYDQIIVNGLLNLSGAALAFTGTTGSVAVIQVVNLIVNDGVDVTGPATNFANGAPVSINGNNYEIYYAAADGNDVILAEASLPTTVYVDDSWAALTSGTAIADADLGTTGAQPATFGVNAFATLATAIAGSSAGATIIVNGGTYAEAVVSAGTRTIEITGPNAAQAVIFNSLTTAVGQNLVLEGTSTLTVGDATSTSVAGLVSGSGSLTKVGAGTLTLSGANTYSGTTTVNVGVLAINAAPLVNPLGTSAVVLSGGTLDVNTAVAAINNALGHAGYHSNNEGAVLDLNNNHGALGYGDVLAGPAFEGLGTLINGPGNRGLDFDNDADFNAVTASLRDDTSGDGFVINQGDNYANLFIGTFTPPTTGTWGFRNAGDDDRGGMWIDLDQDGLFESSPPGLGDVRGEQISWENGTKRNFTLTAGQKYLVAFTHLEFGGGSTIDIRVTDPSNVERVVKPGDAAQTNWWSFSNQMNLALSNNVTVTANSTIDVNAAVTFGTLNIAAGATQLNVASSHAPGTLAGKLSFSGTTTLDGVKTFNHTNQAALNLAGVTQNGGATGGIVKTGDGTLVLAGANTYGGDTTVSGGTVALGNNSGLGNETGKTVVNGGTLDIRGFRAGTNGNELVEIAGTGVRGFGVVQNSGGIQQTSAFRRLTMTANATVRSQYRWDVRNTGGAATFDMGGFDLVKVGGQEVAIVNATINNEGNVAVNENIFRLEGSSDFDGLTKTISVVNGATLDFWANTQTHDVNVTLAGGANLTSNGGSNATISGLVTLNGVANVNTNNNSGLSNLTISGQITGVGGFVKGGTERLTLTNNANDYAGVTTINAGTVVVTVNNALGTAGSGTTVAAGASLRFDATGGALSSAEPLAIAGVGIQNQGALQSLGNNITLSGAVTLRGSASIASHTAGRTMTFNGAVNKAISSDLTLMGAGDFVFNAPINGSGYALSPITARVFNGVQQDLANATILTNDINGVTVPTRTATLNGPLTFANAAAFNALFTPSIPLVDNFTTVFETTLTVVTPGVYTFSVTNNDDGAAVWLKPTANAAFVTGDRLQGIVGNNNTAVATRTLTAGTYTLVYAQREGAGGEAVTGRISGPGLTGVTVGTLLPIVDPALTDGLIKNGAGTATLFGANTYAGLTTVNAGTLIAANSDALGTGAGGTNVEYGGTLALQGGITIANETLRLDGLGAAGQLGALVNLSGSNTIAATSPISARPVNLGEVRLASVAGTLTIDSAINLNSSRLSVDGAGATTINGAISGAGATIGTPIATGVAGVFANVPETVGYTLALEHNNLPNGIVGTAAFPYTVSNTGSIGAYDRIAYYVELTGGAAPGGAAWAYVSMDAFTTNVALIGVPNAPTNWTFQQFVSNLNVFGSASSGLTTGVGLTTGNIEIWPSNYSQGNTLPVPNASSAGDNTGFDFGDGGFNTSVGYGSFQVHNYDRDGIGASGVLGQTIFAYNQWHSGTGDLGIGNRGVAGSANDWTFANNLPAYSVKRLAVLVRELAPAYRQSDNSLTKLGSGTLILAGANTYNGNTAVNGGVLKVGANEVIPHGVGNGNVFINGATLDLCGFTETINGFTGNATAIVDNTAAGAGTLIFGANDQTSNYAGVIQDTAGNVSLEKVGTGTQTFSGVLSNTYQGTTTVTAGTLLVTGGDNLSDLSAGTTVGFAGTLSLGANEATQTLTLETGTADGADVLLAANALTLLGDVTVVVNGTGAVGAAITGIAGSSLNLNGAAPRTFTVADGAASDDVTITTDVTNGAVTKSGPGTMTYAGAQANTYMGATVVNDGVLSLDKDDGVTSIAGPGGVSIGDGVGGGASAVLRVDSDEQIVDTVLITLAGADGQFFVTSGDTETILPLTANFAGGDVRVAGELITTANYVQGPGVPGTTTLAGGTIRVITGLGNYDLNDGTLQGTGTVIVTKVNAFGTIDPGIGATSAGQINIQGNLDIKASGIVNLNVGGTSLPNFDQISVTLNSGITPAPINVTNGTVWFRGTLNTGAIDADGVPAFDYTPTNLDFYDVMTFETRMLDDLALNHLRLPSDFATKNLGPDLVGFRYDARFLSATNQLNAESYNSTTFGLLGAPPPSVGLAKKLRLTALNSLASDVTGATTLTKGGFTSNSTIRHNYQFVTVTNTSGSAINGPIYLEIPSVSLAGVKLYNRAGFTLSGGKEYVVVSPTGLAAGASVQVQLDWLNPNMAAFTYTHRVLAGGLP